MNSDLIQPKRSAYRTARHQHRSGKRVRVANGGYQKFKPAIRFESVTLASIEAKFAIIDARTAVQPHRPTR